MKVMKRISLFFITASLMFGAGSYTTLKVEQFFYPNRYARLEETTSQNPEETSQESSNPDLTSDTGADSVSNTAAGTPGNTAVNQTERVIEAAMEEVPVITADTIYLIEKVNLSDGTVEEQEEPVPVKYIGMDRMNLLEELVAYDNNPPLSELKLGFETIELTAFSKERVVICKYYRPQEEEKGFYLMVADHFVIVYEEDKQTIHTMTDILLENLSEDLQEEIMQGKYMENEQELYNFLESYSS